MKEFYKTVFMVTTFSAIEKALGFVYRIYLSRAIGSEGVGLYQIALSVYAVFLTLCCSGIPVTVSRLVTKYRATHNESRVHSIMTAGILLATLIGAFLTLLSLIGRGALSFIFADERCLKLFIMIIPVLTINSVYAVLRGVFWGNKDFLPYSVVELLEEFVMIVIGIILIERASTIYDGTKMAIVAVVISYGFSFIVASALFFIRKNTIKNPRRELKILIKSSTPITAMRTANSLITSLVSIILPMRLIASGMTNEVAMSTYGAAFGMAMPLLFVPSTIISSFTLVLIPEISTAYYSKKDSVLKHEIEKSIKFAVLISALFIPIFFVCGTELGILIFDNELCGKYLSESAFLMLGMSLSSLTTSMLNSIGKETKSLIYYLLSAILMLLCIWFLPAIIGIHSLLVGFTFVFYLTTILNLILLQKSCKFHIAYKRFILVALIFILPSSLLGILLKGILLNYLGSLLTTIILAIVITLFNLTLYKVFNMLDFSVLLNALKHKNKLGKRIVEKSI